MHINIHVSCYCLAKKKDKSLTYSSAASLIKYPFIFQCLCKCLEFQFDHVISDRIMILQRLHLMSNILKDQDILNWEFFLARFDALSLEAQIDLENSGEIACLTGYNDYNKLPGNGLVSKFVVLTDDVLFFF